MATRVSNFAQQERYVAAELGARLLQVLQFSAYGFQAKDIAVVMGISPLTVKQYRVRICQHLGADNITHAVAVGLRRELIF